MTMFKFIKQYAASLNNIAVYPMISLLIFFIFFVVLVVWVKKMSKENIKRLSELPFDKEEIVNSTL